MFDLHMHTKLSDGALTVAQLLADVKEKGITPFSITDHNHALAYEEIALSQFPDLIVGTEITSSYKGVVVEILGYNIDYTIINAWYRSFYSAENIAKKEDILFQRLKKICVDNGLKLTENLEMETIEKGVSKKTIYYDLVDNKNKLQFKSYKEFFRKGLSNPGSVWFIDEGTTYPLLDDVVALIHKAGGIAILAHPYEYGIDDLHDLYEYLLSIKIDGIESFHPSASLNQSKDIASYVIENGLVSSGGSDFHRYDRLIPLGVHLSEVLYSWSCFDWFKNK